MRDEDGGAESAYKNGGRNISINGYSCFREEGQNTVVNEVACLVMCCSANRIIVMKGRTFYNLRRNYLNSELR